MANHLIEKAVKTLNYTVKHKFKNQKQRELFDTILANRITFIHGPAGTGKTFVALKAGLEAMKKKEQHKIIITKPIVEASSPMGHLPGDVREKTSQYMYSFHANLKKLLGEAACQRFVADGLIKEVPLNFARGNTFGDYDKDGNALGEFCILDEAQNATVKDVKLFISRMGEKSKIIVMGDNDQTDLKLKVGEKTGLDDAFKRFEGLDGVGFFQFTDDDIVRDPFLIEVMKRYRTK